jgi:hypothetical protein
MAEYHIPLPTAIWDTPLAVPLALLPVRNERHGGDTGPSHTTRASIRARNRARAWLAAHFTLVPKPPSETGWHLGKTPLPL